MLVCPVSGKDCSRNCGQSPENPELAGLCERLGFAPMREREETVEEVLDYHGQPLHEGDRVEAWYRGQRYTAVVRSIAPYDGRTSYRHVTLTRDDDGGEARSFSDAVVVINERTS